MPYIIVSIQCPSKRSGNIKPNYHKQSSYIPLSNVWTQQQPIKKSKFKKIFMSSSATKSLECCFVQKLNYCRSFNPILLAIPCRLPPCCIYYNRIWVFHISLSKSTSSSKTTNTHPVPYFACFQSWNQYISVLF